MEERSSLIEELDLSFHPLTQKLWRDFELLFGRNGACGGCWCMYWKLRGKAFEENTGDTARQIAKSHCGFENRPWPAGLFRRLPCRLDRGRAAQRLPQAGTLTRPQACGRSASLVDHLLFGREERRRKEIAVELLKLPSNMSGSRAVKLSKAIPWTQPKTKPMPLFTQVRHPLSEKLVSWKLFAIRPHVPFFGMLFIPSPSGCKQQGEGA